jgi:diaminobutyrate-2-oxoglutarate transaminase
MWEFIVTATASTGNRLSAPEPQPHASRPASVAPRPRGVPRAILDRQERRESSARTYARHLPIVPVRADGMVVHGADGRAYLDCLSGAGSLALGHNHPVVHAAIRRVLDSGAPLHILDLATPIKDDFTDALFDVLPAGLRDGGARVHFCGPSGADAVEAALKLTRIATGRRGLLAFTGGYHGMTAGALAATGHLDARTPAGAGDPGLTRLPFPYPYRAPLGADPDGVRAAAFVGRLLDDPASGVTPPAALLVEPVQGEGGVLPAPDRWLRELRRISGAHGVPLIADEVQTGLGRTGALWGCEHAGVTPDVLVLAKAVGGGLPLAVIVYRAELDSWAEGAHTGTFRGNQLAMAAGAATIRHIVEHRLAERAASVGDRLLRALDALRASHPGIGDVRGRGLMIGVELVDADAAPDAGGARPADPRLARAVRAACLARGLIVELGGRHGAVLRLLPPLVITDAQADQVIDVIDQALRAAHRDRRVSEAA